MARGTQLPYAPPRSVLAWILSSPTMCRVWHPHKPFGPFFSHHACVVWGTLITPFIVYAVQIFRTSSH